MTTQQLSQSASHYTTPPHERPWDRLLARALAPSLDRQLAAGSAPQSSLALTIRAREIVSPAARRELASRWAAVLDQAGRPATLISSRPLQRAAVIAAAPELRELVSVLGSGVPISVRGAAMASSLLSDGAGPLYNRRAAAGLGNAVHAAARQAAAADDLPEEAAAR